MENHLCHSIGRAWILNTLTSAGLINFGGNSLQGDGSKRAKNQHFTGSYFEFTWQKLSKTHLSPWSLGMH